MFEKLQGKLEAAHQEVAKTSIPPGILSMLIDTVVSLLGGCLQQKSSADVAKQMQTNPIITRVAIRQALRKQQVIPTNTLVETVIKASEGATPEDLEAVKEIDFVM